MNRPRLLPIVLCSVVLAGCFTALVPPPEPVEVDTATVVKGNTRFAMDLYGKLRAKDGNLFFSPFSISSALAMTSAGARDKTLEQMAKVLHLPEDEALHPTLGKLLRQVNSPKKGAYDLSTANALWVQTGKRYEPAFLKLTGEDYGAGLKEVDFAGNVEGARQAINAYVEKKTNQKIKDLIKKGTIGSDARLVLTNAIYFKGDWAVPFKTEATMEDDFTLADGKAVEAKFMNQTGKFPFYKGAGFQVLEMPYAGKDISMVFLLPDKADGLPALEKQLTADKLAGWLGQLKVEPQVRIMLPRFKMTREFNLTKTLVAMGMRDAFGKAADFSGIDGGKDNLGLSMVVHKAFVEVNEKGTEAAAATGVGVTKRGGKIIPIFNADHPFLFLIRDKRSDSLLFLGRLANPAKE